MNLKILIVFPLFYCLVGFGQVKTGKASFYSKDFKGRLTASGEKFNPQKLTAAHRHLPFNTRVRVTNLANNKSVVVRINDRGPFVSGRIIDLSPAAAQKLGIDGVTDVALKVVDKDTKLTRKPVQGDKSSSLKKSPAGQDRQTVKTQLGKTTGASKQTTAPQKTDTVRSDSTIVRETEFYTMSTTRSQPKGYGVQIGTFQESANLLSLANQLSSRFQKKITVQVKVVGKTRVYSLILGKFGSHKKAEKFIDTIDKTYPDSFVVDFSKSGK